MWREAAAPILFDAFARLGGPVAPLPHPPRGAIVTSNARLPPPLRQFQPGRLAGETAQPPLHIIFPPDGARLDLASVLRAQGKSEEARRLYQEILDLSQDYQYRAFPEAVDACGRLAYALLRSDDVDLPSFLLEPILRVVDFLSLAGIAGQQQDFEHGDVPVAEPVSRLYRTFGLS